MALGRRSVLEVASTWRAPLPPVAVTLALWVSSGCRAGDTPAGTAYSPPDLQIVSAGDAPRQLLRYRPAIGSQQKLEVAIDIDLRAQDLGGPMPTLVIAMTVGIDALLPTGQLRVRATIDDVSARDHPESKVLASALAGPLEPLEGLAIDALLSSDGRLAGARIDRGGRTLSSDLEAQLASLVASFEQTMMPLPDEPVGVGAVWRNSRAVAHNGMKLVAVNTISVTGLADDVLSYTIDTDIHGQAQVVAQGDSRIAVTDIVGSAGGKGSIGLVTLRVTSELLAELRSEMKADDDDTATRMTMVTLSRVRPL
jgi:hypothetical protein